MARHSPTGVTGGPRRPQVDRDICASFERGELVRVVELYRETLTQDCQLEPSTLAAVVDACSRRGEMNEAVEVFTAVCEQAQAPLLPMYASLIIGYSACDNSADTATALDLLIVMQSHDAPADQDLYDSVLRSCARQRDISLAEQVVASMVAAAVTPSSVTLTILVGLYVCCSFFDRAVETIDMFSQEYGIFLSASALRELVKVCALHGEANHAMGIYIRLRQGDGATDAEMLRALLACCLDAHDASGTRRLLNDEASLFCDHSRDGGSPVPLRQWLDCESTEAALLLLHRNQIQDLADPTLAELADRLVAAGGHVSERLRRVSWCRGEAAFPNSSRFLDRRAQHTVCVY